MSGYLRINPGEAVQLGGLTLPGVVELVAVTGDLSIDEQNLENTDLKTLAVRGFTTQKVSITLRLVGETQADLMRQLGQLQRAFQVDRVKNGAKLLPVRVVNPHLDARRMKKVLFDSLSSSEGNAAENEITVTLNLHEFDADVGRLKKRADEEQERRKKAAADAAKSAKSGGAGSGKGAASGAGAGGAGAGAGGPDGTRTPPGPGSSTGGKTTNGAPSAFSKGFGAGAGVVNGLIGR